MDAVNKRPTAEAVEYLEQFLSGDRLPPGKANLLAREMLGVREVEHDAPFEVLEQGDWGIMEFIDVGSMGVALRCRPTRYGGDTWLLTVDQLKRLLAATEGKQ